MDNFIQDVWLSQAFGLFLWLVLAAVLFAPMLMEWLHQRSAFDIFDTKHIFRLVYFLYFGLPSIYYLFYPGSFDYVQNFDNSLRVVLSMAIIGGLAFYGGYLIKLPWQPRLPSAAWSPTRLAILVVLFTLISVVSFGLLMERVGGACYYFTHLGQTNELMMGNTYFLWGILLLKSAALLLLAYIAKAQRKPWWLWLITALYIGLALLLVAFMGSRILAVIFVFEVLVVINYLIKKIHLAILSIVIAAVIVVIVGVLGEFRNFSWVAPDVCSATNNQATLEQRRLEEPDLSQEQRQQLLNQASQSSTQQHVTSQEYADAFAKELGKLSSDRQLLIERYINNYFDSVRTTMMTYENTPQLIRYQYGLGYAQAVLQPIPGSVRPKITLPNDGPNIFSGGGAYSRIQSVLGEAYTNFSWFGVVVVPLVMGILARFAYQVRQHHKDNRWSVVFYAVSIGGLMIYIRGYFTGHTALFLMDLTPLILAMLVMCWPWRKGTA